MKFELIAPCYFGTESTAAFEVRRLGAENVQVTDGRIVFSVDENMIAAGIVDPAKVTRSALQHAASIAAMLLTTETLIADIPKKEPVLPAGAPGGDYGMM